MAIINDVGGTSLNSFSINGGVSFYQGKNDPNIKMGKDGDYYFKSDGYLYVKRKGTWLNITSSAMPDARHIKNKLIYSNGENYAPSGISYNADTKGTYMDGALVIGEHPAANNGNSKIVPTIGWINDPELSTNVVHRSGNEIISGLKKFNNDIILNSVSDYCRDYVVVHDQVSKGNVPTVHSPYDDNDYTKYCSFIAVDSNGYKKGVIENGKHIVNNNKLGQFEIKYGRQNTGTEAKPNYQATTIVAMECFKPLANNDTRAWIRTYWDGKGKAYAQTNVDPADGSTGTTQNIATTNWMINNFYPNTIQPYVNSTAQTITKNYVDNSVKIKKIGELIWSPIPLQNTTGLHLMDGGSVTKNSYIDFYNYIKGLSSNNIKKNTSSTSDNRTNEEKKYKFCVASDRIYLPNYSNLMVLSPTGSSSDVGKYYAPGLPNITGTWAEDSFAGFNSGAISYGNTLSGQSGSDRGTGKETFFNASKSNSIYGASTTVQPENTKVYVYIVVANNVVGDTSSLNINKLITEINTYENQVTSLSSTVSSLTTGTSGSITWWYDSKTKLLIQCGYIKGNKGNKIVSFAKPYANKNYSVASTCAVKYYDAPWGTNTIGIDDNNNWGGWEDLQKSTSRFICYQVHDISRWWIAIGKGA